MPSEQLQGLLEVFLSKKAELDAADLSLTGAKDELIAAQAVVVEKQVVVDSALEGRSAARIAYNGSIDELIATLSALKIVVE